MKPHPDLKVLQELFPAIRKYQELATKHGIRDIFQDNGGKLLQVLLTTGLKGLPDREGNDAEDENGREYEIKTLNILLQNQFTTHHHLNPTILSKYRKADWIFAIYKGIELQSIYLMKPADLERQYFAKWDAKFAAGKEHLNNPKIRADFVITNGKLIAGLQPLPSSLFRK